MAAEMGNLLGSETASGSKTANMAEPVKPGVSYTIGGVKVDFPVKAYPSQISMMDKIIRGCHRAQNCLLESPTGSGKTLALLCGALAWQKAEAKKLRELAAVEHQKKVQEMLQTLQEANQSSANVANPKENIEKPMKSTENPQEVAKPLENAQQVVKFKVNEGDITKAFCAPGRPKFKYDDESDDEEDIFRSDVKKVKIDPAPIDSVVDLTGDGDQMDKINQNPASSSSTDCPEKGCDPHTFEQFLAMNSTPPSVRGPKIFFGTRTHKQIAQVLHELRRTAYADVRSCILSSRNHSCIHEYASQPNVNRNDMCHDLLDPKTRGDCRFFHNVKRYCTHAVLEANGIPSVWDLEDLTKFGREKTSCPYFMARELMLASDIVFCPYNYLLDPMIRDSMGIVLTGNILILDEAHNIEDTCRDSASFSIAQDDILDAIHIFEETASMVGCEALYNAMAKVLSSLSLWIDQHRGEVTDLTDYDVGKWMLSGHQAVEKFDGYEFGPSNFHNFKETFLMLNEQKKEEENADSSAMSGATKNLISGLILVLEYLYDERHTRDYHVVLTKSFSHDNSNNPVANSQGWLNVRKKRNRNAHWRFTLNFWCFNPAVVFEAVREQARSVVLTSGTLSPMDSFQSELGATFPITLEANHVIDPSQCLIRSLGFGPNRVCLDGKYASTNTYPFQDEIGQIILQISSFVPHGILCFVSSYSLLDKLVERWTLTGTKAKISQHKVIICEPRRSSEFEPTMKSFYETIENTSQTPVGQGVTGAFFMAVCRGKVSEGLDFADKNARVIITIGIPFPNIKDSQVTLKKTYNDQHRISKGLLSGSDWYQIQAYRALNQALGRCIRHRNDWGAILLFDNRFSNNYYYKSLSKWVRNKVQHHSNYHDLIHQLNEFIKYRLQIDREAK